jgi:hypothetical protein
MHQKDYSKKKKALEEVIQIFGPVELIRAIQGFIRREIKRKLKLREVRQETRESI